MQKNSCKYFNGVQDDHSVCGMNINYRQLVGGNDHGWIRRLPCFTFREEDKPNQVHCDSFTLPTLEELADFETTLRLLLERHAKAMPLIFTMKKEYHGRDGQQIIDCPICGGRLHMTHAAMNGHVWGKCETPDCMEWIE
jgi:hypothetical protein